MSVLRTIRSLLFIGQMYFAMLPLAIAFLPWALFSRRGAVAAAHAYCWWVRFTARWMVGIRTEVRGEVPTGQVMVAAKHQSFLDIILIFSALDRPKFIMKKELVWAPILGQYALRMGCIPVDRGKRAEAIRKMLADVERGKVEGGQLIIYPQGTRIAPGVKAAYKVGTGVIYGQLGQPCVPVATNVGLFWPRRGIRRTPGLAVVEFLPPIAPGRPVPEMMQELEREVEQRSNMLMAEAGFAPIREGQDDVD
ncbi:lysophospholipid acyltransferase family protein [Histidinibacterium aquaticum]|uniref:1-acyl-sn-glycerol-3-phosphate acyltransferase n=1 Tax=Histidinibacterium aquaticum TaxID=2613962 RepID=A0A5J5GR42_9RHOB|nr:lysophospholipid acyltransferase family protein [Histidinibacterium aquaticum]KAA9010537.1 1-acyl-sn-glycerol-3-phosphate acyltransferase [Histidinibacterium aquaticum]